MLMRSRTSIDNDFTPFDSRLLLLLQSFACRSNKIMQKRVASKHASEAARISRRTEHPKEGFSELMSPEKGFLKGQKKVSFTPRQRYSIGHWVGEERVYTHKSKVIRSLEVSVWQLKKDEKCVFFLHRDVTTVSEFDGAFAFCVHFFFFLRVFL